jgi:hypothetical protein
MMDIREQASRAVDALNRLHGARAELERLGTALPSGERARADRVRQRLLAIEGQLQRLTGEHSMELMPKGLYNRLGTLSRAVQSAESAPTRAEYAVFREIEAGIAEQVRLLDELIEGDLATLKGGGEHE